MPKPKKPKRRNEKESGTARERNNKTAIVGATSKRAKRLLNQSRLIGQ